MTRMYEYLGVDLRGVELGGGNEFRGTKDPDGRPGCQAA